MVLEKVDMKVDQVVEKMGKLEAWVEDLAGMVTMLRNIVPQMNQEQVCLVGINIHTTEALRQCSVRVMDLAMRVVVLEHRPWNLVIIDDDSDSEMVVTDEVVREENEVPILILPPGQLVETADYDRKEFVPAGGGLEEGLEIERA